MPMSLHIDSLGSKLYTVSEISQMLVKQLSNFDFIFVCIGKQCPVTQLDAMRCKKKLLSSASATVYYRDVCTAPSIGTIYTSF